jgi:hypothetical protein
MVCCLPIRNLKGILPMNAHAVRSVMWTSLVLSLLSACDNETTLSPVTFSGPAGVRDCNAWIYAATCKQLQLKDGTVTITDGTYGNPISTLPGNSGTPGTISDLLVRGRYDTQVEVGASPSLALGIGPPACAAVSPVFVGVGAMVIDFHITGDYKWIFGNGYRDAQGTNQTNGLITDSNLTIVVFNIHDVPAAVDNTAKDLARDTVKRAVDARVSQELNKLLGLGSTPISGLPVYAPGYNPYSSSCR